MSLPTIPRRFPLFWNYEGNDRSYVQVQRFKTTWAHTSLSIINNVVVMVLVSSYRSLPL